MPLRRPSQTKTGTAAGPQIRSTPRRVQGAREGPWVVGIGASAGGLETVRRLLGALPTGGGMAFILVQHLDPTHQSMLVELLTDHTPLTVLEAVDGATLQPDHIYVIPPGTYLSLAEGALRLSPPNQRHGARLPFDFLLYSLADACGERAICVVLSGTGADGSAGLAAIHTAGGWVIAQDPQDAAFPGMPRAAIATGLVDRVLTADRIAGALAEATLRDFKPSAGAGEAAGGLAEIVDLLRAKTAHDFRLYKPGTLSRRIARRMAMAGFEANGMKAYLEVLRRDDVEVNLLANDLLINITSFFRDPEVFEALAQRTVRDLIASHAPDQAVRVWIPGCSTGEEAYSLAIIFREQLSAARLHLKLQVFASDVDADAVARPRDGLYPPSVTDRISPERLTRFFTREEQGYRVTPDLRGAIVFTTHDVLADPPFSRLDLISCRNLLIYLNPEAQARVLGIFHFALAPGGLLLLGRSESPGAAPDRFEAVAKPERLYRRIGRNREGDLGFDVDSGADARPAPRRQAPAVIPRQMPLAELCRRLVLDAYAPAAVLINHRMECLFSLGPTDHYLRVGPGHPTQNLLAMARQGLRAKLRDAIELAIQTKVRVVTPGGRVNASDGATGFEISVQPTTHQGEALLLVCFAPTATRADIPTRAAAPEDQSRIRELEQELAAARADVSNAVRSLEISNEEQRSINDEALSVNEEFQSTNEELLTSKEELQSLNEELTALNTQLRETVDRHRVISNDLQNILYSTDVATIFLDADLNIAFFTPATKSLFSILAGDIGRPLADLHPLAPDATLWTDAQLVLKGASPLDREIEDGAGAWFMRRISPYRADDGGVEGVVITFTVITERKRAAKSLEEAKMAAELANATKSRFLASASHDLRQPLQALAFVQGLLAKVATGEREIELIGRLDEILNAMTGMLNTLLDINQIEAGVVRPDVKAFSVREILDRIRVEFTDLAQGRGLALKIVDSSLTVTSDPRLLEQMLRNIVANALKYTPKGRVLIGCRRRRGLLSLEIWDTGIGIAAENHESIFEEYRQVDNPARERNRGMGLGLSIVQRLGDLLGHRVVVRSRPGRGSVFAIETSSPAAQDTALPAEETRPVDQPVERAARHGNILVIEDDPEVAELLELLLTTAGHSVRVAPDGVGVMDFVSKGAVRPDIILADYNLPGEVTGLEAISKIRKGLGQPIAAIILTGDISTATLREVVRHDCIQLSKPVKPSYLTRLIEDLLPAPRPRATPGPQGPALASDPMIFVIEDDRQVREALCGVLKDDGRGVRAYDSAEAFLDAEGAATQGCLLIDAGLPGLSGVALLERLQAEGWPLAAVMITGAGDVSMAVRAMRAGALNFIEKPIAAADLLASLDLAMEHARDEGKRFAWRADAARLVAALTDRERQVMDLVVAGHPSKNIAADLGISQRTVETHRASVMKKTGSKSLPALARMALGAASI